MTDYFTDLFAYDHWANRQWLDHLRAIEEEVPRTRALLAHIPAAKRLWWLRLTGADATGFDFWPALSLDACAALMDEVHAAYTDYLAGLSEDDLMQALAYRNSKGTPFETPRRDVFMHLLTHGHYHRGQIAQAVRQAGHAPIWTDYLAYMRRT